MESRYIRCRIFANSRGSWPDPASGTAPRRIATASFTETENQAYSI